MKVITLWQPWATLIALGLKTIETRNNSRFRVLHGQRIGIHAGNKWDTNWLELTESYLTHQQALEIDELRETNSIPFGKIICTAEVLNFRALFATDSRKALINCDSNEIGFYRYGLFLGNIEQCNIPIKGHQGIWEYKGELK